MAGRERELHVWMNGEHVAVWSWSRAGVAQLQYSAQWRGSANARALSLSLPIPAGLTALTGPAVSNYFDNLLPDSEHIRERLRARWRAASTEPFALLKEIGRDCVGAVQLLPDGESPGNHRTLRSRPLDTADVERLLLDTTSDALLGQPRQGEDLRISIAGAQEKTALLRIGERWHLPQGPTPTTHIFKLPLGLIGPMRADMSHSVENEWLCLRILAALGFRVPSCEITAFGLQQVLVVERFDRRWVDGGRWIARLPQEDFCQATATAGADKYEASGGPGIAACLRLLQASESSELDKLSFVMAQLAFWLLAAIDGHAKNYSIFLQRDSRFSMTPLYDVLSAWPIIGDGPNQLALQRAKLAMAVRAKNAHWKLVELQPRHWAMLAAQSGVPDAFDAMTTLVDESRDALAQVRRELPAGFPMRVWTKIEQGVMAQRTLFQRGR